VSEEPEVNIAERFLLKPEDVISIDEIVELREGEIDDNIHDTYEEEFGTNPLTILLMQEQEALNNGSQSPFRSEEGLAREMLACIRFSK
jgi:hypothetical protein